MAGTVELERDRTLRLTTAWLVPVLVVLFFVSGACGLIYQVLWLRLLSLVFGVTVWAASTVLASFMAGLGLGSLLAGRLVDRARMPLLWYGAIEICVGLSALLTPVALDAVQQWYVALYPMLGDSLWGLTVARFVLSSAILLLPATLMGATLPIVVKSSLLRDEGLGQRISVLYAANTAGAVAGVVLGGFVLIGGVGIAASFGIAAALNVGVGLLALLGALLLGPPRPVAPAARVAQEPAPESDAQASASVRRVVLLVFAISGFASLALEVIWFRTLVLYLVATTYAFTIMLATVLSGIAAGSMLVAPLMRRQLDWLKVLAIVELGIAVVAASSLALLTRAPDLFASAGVLLPFLPSYVGAAVIASFLALFPASLLLGIAFPLGLRIWAGDSAPEGQTGRRVGLFYSLNVFGSIAGSIAGGFILLPSLGSRSSLALISAIVLVSALLLLSFLPQRRLALSVAGGGAVLFFAVVASMPDPFADAVARRYPGERLLWQEEGVQTTVTVHERADRGIALYLDGLYQASDVPGQLRIHRMNGHLPMLLHPGPESALVVGLGGGVTAGAVSLHPAQVDVLELSNSVIAGAEWFRHVNYEPLRRPNVRLRVDDGRNFLLLSPRRYDVVTSDVVGPTHAGAGNLYSAEYFQLVRDALPEDGVVAQWVGPFAETQHKLIFRTFLSVFPESTLWVDGTVLIGSKRPLRLDRASVERRLQDPVLRESLAAIGIHDFDSLLALYWAGPEELRHYVGEGPILTDDRPMVEYFLSLPTNEPPADLSAVRGDVRRVVAE